MRIQVPTARPRPSGQTRSRVSEAQKGHLCARLLLASSSGMFACAIAKIEAPLLGSQVNREPTTRPSKYRPAAEKQLGRQYRLGMSTRQLYLARKEDQKVSGGN